MPSQVNSVALRGYLDTLHTLARYVGTLDPIDAGWLCAQLASEGTDSLRMCWALLDAPLPHTGRTVVDLYRSNEANRLSPEAALRLDTLAASYPAFYEVRSVTEAGAVFRELVSETLWTVTGRGEKADEGIFPASAPRTAPGEIHLCRLVGSPAAAVVLGPPFVYAPDARDDCARMVHGFIEAELHAGQSLRDALRRGMKAATPRLVQVLA